MKAWLGLMMVASACGAGDDVTDGARGLCAAGGALNACPDAARSPEAACWRMVDCAAIPLRSGVNNVFDWGACVDYLDTLTADRERLVVDCIAASTCDELKANGSPQQPYRDQFTCIRLGDQ